MSSNTPRVHLTHVRYCEREIVSTSDLFDPSIGNALLPLLDSGRLSEKLYLDRLGRIVKFFHGERVQMVVELRALVHTQLSV